MVVEGGGGGGGCEKEDERREISGHQDRDYFFSKKGRRISSLTASLRPVTPCECATGRLGSNSCVAETQSTTRHLAECKERGGDGVCGEGFAAS
jgi:hypothetical protein